MNEVTQLEPTKERKAPEHWKIDFVVLISEGVGGSESACFLGTVYVMGMIGLVVL